MRRDLIFVSLSLLTWGVGESAFFAFQPLYLQELGADPFQIGTIYGAFGLAASLVHIPAGYLSDRYGRRPVMWAAWLVGLIATWVMALANSLPWFVAGMILYGMTMFVIAPLNSYVTAARGNLSVGRALTLISSAYNLGVISGPLIGGIVGDRYGFKTIFLMAGCIFIISTILILFIKAQPRDIPSHHAKNYRLITNARFMAFLPIFFLVIFATYLPQPLSPNYLQSQHDLSLASIGRLYSINGIGIVTLNLTLGYLDARLGFLIGQLAVALFSILLWKGNGMLAFATGYFLVGGFRTARLLAVAQVRAMIQSADMGLAFGLMETAGALALILAAPVSGLLYEKDPVAMYIVSAGMIVGTILISALYLYYKRAGGYQGLSEYEDGASG